MAAERDGRRGAARRARRVALCLAALAAAALGTSPAAAVLSRDQVLAKARAGATAAEILQASFPGATVRRRAGVRLRVLVADLAPRVIVSAQTPLALIDEGAEGSAPATLPANHRFEIARRGAAWTIRDLDDPAGAARTLTGPVRLDAGSAATGVRMADPLGRRYRGALRLVPSLRTTIAVVNLVAVEDWVPAVVGAEVPPAWRANPQAVEATAILERSRALARAGARGRVWDVTSEDPGYDGIDGERPATTRATLPTRGMVLLARSRPIDSSFTVVPGAVTTLPPNLGRPVKVAEGPARPIAGAPAGVGPTAVQRALDQVGTPYAWGGESPGGFDCSGLVWYAFEALGIALPRIAEDQARVGVPVMAQDLRPGDVVFFADSSGYVHHEGIYIGGGQMVHAPSTGRTVTTVRIDVGYYARQYAGARRYSPER
jgi:cell wall-associated NlpC family hydrolase